MALTYGFYNSLNGDRKYDAVQMSQIFDGIINDGIFMSIGDKLMVTANEGMTVKVGTGRAWFNGTWTRNDAPYILTLEPANLLLKRIDAVALEVNASDDVRENSIKIITGTPSSEPVKPDLARTEKVNQYPLAYISVGIGALEILQADIENAVGLTPCPFVTGILETVNIDDLVIQWENQWENWMVDMMRSAEAFKSDQESSFVEWSTQRRTEFDEWYANVQYVLEGDVAAKLSGQISEANNQIANLQNNKVDKVDGKGLSTDDYIQPVFVESVLEVANWSNGAYSFEDEYPSSQYDIEIFQSDKCTKTQYNQYGDAKIVGNPATNVIKALGDIPEEDLPIFIKVVTKT